MALPVDALHRWPIVFDAGAAMVTDRWWGSLCPRCDGYPASHDLPGAPASKWKDSRKAGGSLSGSPGVFVCVQPHSTTLFGVPFPLPTHPTPQGAGIGDSGTSPRPRFESCARQSSGHEATSANLFRNECQVCNEARKPSCPAPHIQSSETIVTSQPWLG